MNIDDLTIKQAKEIVNMFGSTHLFLPDNKMIGHYVIVRCRDAGVHAGFLEAYEGRSCVLTETRRLWKWISKEGKWLSGVALHGLGKGSMISEECPRIHLTENCEIILATDVSEKSIREFPSDE